MACRTTDSGFEHLVRLGTPFACLLGLAAIIAFSPQDLRYDEIYHLNTAQMALDSGWREALSSPGNKSAVGPLYAAIHLALAPVTGLRAPAIRWVNFGCLIGIITLLSWQLRGWGVADRWLAAASLLAVPFVWPPSGLALTEIPALLAFTAFSLTMQAALHSVDSTPASCARDAGWGGLAGMFLGLAILGRQTYLVVVPALVVLGLWFPRRAALFLLSGATALSLSGWLFLLWGGMVPPSQQLCLAGVRLDHGVLSLSYVGAAALCLNPAWMRPRNRWVMTAMLFLGAGIGNLAWGNSEPPAKTLLVRLLGQQMARPAGFSIEVGLTFLGLLWLSNLLVFVWEHRHDPERAFQSVVLVALAAAPVMISHQFSSRYVVGLLGVLLVLVGPANVLQGRWGLRTLGGGAVGGAMLWTYLR